MERLTKLEIAEMNSDPEWRARLIRIAHLSEMLGACIIFSDYRVPDEINAAIQLTTEGSRVLQEATRKKITAKEARLMCLLELFHRELLIDVRTTNLEALEQAFSSQIRSKKIHFPPVLGRHLYDRAADIFEDLEEHLTLSQTEELLDGLEQGIAQFGPYLVGPQGLFKVAPERRFAASRYLVPLFHCADPSCAAVHLCSLSTDWDAPINDKRNEFKKILERDGKDPSDWSDFIDDLVYDEGKPFDDLDLSSTPYLLGDAFSVEELHAVMRHVLDGSQSAETRVRLAELGIKNTGSATVITQSLTQYQAIQFLLTYNDKDILEVLEDAVSSNVVVMPMSEIRRPVITRGWRSPGPYGPQVEISALGYRVTARDAQIASLRLVRLVYQIYPIDTVEQENELEWLLRDIDGPTVRGRLEDFLRTGTPEEVLRTLVLCKRANVLIAEHTLGIDDAPRSDREHLDGILWKLGFSPLLPDAERKLFWLTHTRLEQAAKTATTSGFIDYDILRGQCGTYFPELERVLLDSLLYSTWALLHDHFAADRPFTYVPDLHREWAMRELNRQIELEVQEPADRYVYKEDNVTLGPMIDGFRILGRLLQRVVDEGASALRDQNQTPKFMEYTSLQSFPFAHTAPILDLTSTSAKRFINLFNRVATELIHADVPAVRNEQAHYRRHRSTTSMDRLANALVAIRDALRSLEASGCVRILFRRTAIDHDAWGRRTHFLTDDDGEKFAIMTPSEYDWVRLPPLGDSQYVMQDATIREPNEVLRFRVQPQSGFSELWSNYPRRRRRTAPIAKMPVRQEARSLQSDHTVAQS